MSLVKVIHIAEEFQQALAQPGKLVVAYFTAKWCGPCKQISPIVDQLSVKFPNVSFIKVDVDELQSVARTCGIKAMPTFQFYKNTQKIEEFTGANAGRLEQAINTHQTGDSSTEKDGTFMELTSFYEKPQVNCLNEDSNFTIQNFLNGKSHLQSDCDAQLLIEIPFNQLVKINSIKISTKDLKYGPKTVKLFVNRPKLGFDDASSIPPQQEIVLTEKELQGENVALKFVKFQRVANLQVFVEDNQEDEDYTQINEIKIFGSLESSSNMKDFARVSGEKGESE